MKNLTRLSLLIFLLFTLFSINVKSQNSFTLPVGYDISEDYSGNQQRCDGDFDGDGVDDVAVLCVDKYDTKIVVVYLASKWLIDKSYWWFPWELEIYNFEYLNNVLIIESYTNDFSITLKLQYFANINNMKLIGYDYYSGMDPEYRYHKSINLNTGEYQVNEGQKKKITLDLITLSNIEKYFDYLQQIGQDEAERSLTDKLAKNINLTESTDNPQNAGDRGQVDYNFTGTIGNNSIQLTFQEFATNYNWLSGYYSYTKYNKTIEFAGEEGVFDGQILLKETVNGQNTGYFIFNNLDYSQNKIVGKWYNMDGSVSYDVVLNKK